MEGRKYEEAEGFQEEFSEQIAKQYNRRSIMASRKPAAPTAEPKNGVKASKVSKQTMVNAIVNLENQMDVIGKTLAILDDAFRQFITFSGESDDFQVHLDEVMALRKKAAEEKAEKKIESDKESK